MCNRPGWVYMFYITGLNFIITICQTFKKSKFTKLFSRYTVYIHACTACKPYILKSHLDSIIQLHTTDTFLFICVNISCIFDSQLQVIWLAVTLVNRAIIAKIWIINEVQNLPWLFLMIWHSVIIPFWLSIL